MLSVGDTVEDFTLSDQTGADVRWADYRGRPVVVFFYPKASTPGCTTEAVAFRDTRSQFERSGVAMLGVSADPVKRQAAFSDKHDLSMPLLSDPDHVILEPWGVWGEKKLYGRSSMGIIRSTFLFDAQGRVAHVWSPVRVKGHVERVLERVQAAATSP